MRPGTKQWLEIAESDYKVSLLLFKYSHHPQAVYAICQAIEKILKAAQIEFAHTRPKKVHQLKSIAQETSLAFSQAQYKTLKELSRHYSKVRYPDFARMEYNTQAKVSPIIKQGKEMYLWILAKFNNP
jgi:HEPN domain-containing protein